MSITCHLDFAIFVSIILDIDNIFLIKGLDEGVHTIVDNQLNKKLGVGELYSISSSSLLQGKSNA